MKKIFTVKQQVYDAFGATVGVATHVSHLQTAGEAIQEADERIDGLGAQFSTELLSCTWRYVHNNEE